MIICELYFHLIIVSFLNEEVIEVASFQTWIYIYAKFDKVVVIDNLLYVHVDV